MKFKKSVLFMVLFGVMVLFSSASYAAAPLENVLGFVPDSPIFIAVLRSPGDAYKNYLGYGFESAIPKLREYVAEYEKKTGISLVEDSALTENYVIALTEANPLLLTFEFVSALEVADAQKYSKYLDAWLISNKITRSKVMKISGHEVYSLMSPDIKTPLFYIQKGNFVISSNKLEGLSKALNTAARSELSFAKSRAYEIIKTKYSIDSHFYFWFSGKVIANYFKIFNTDVAYAAISTAMLNISKEEFVKTFDYVMKSLEFIAFKIYVNKDDATFDFIASMNHTVAKVVKAKFNLLKLESKTLFKYDGIEMNSLKLIPEAVKGFISMHIVLPAYDEIVAHMKGKNTGKVKIGAVNFEGIEELNARMLKKFGAGFDRLIHSWTSNEFFAASIENVPGRVYGAKINNMAKLEDALSIVERKAPSLKYRRSSVKYNDVLIKTAKKINRREKTERFYAYFVAGDYFVVATSMEAAKIVIDTFNDKAPSIRVKNSFAYACNYELNSKHQMLGYGKLQPLFEKASPYINGTLGISNFDASKITLKIFGMNNCIDEAGKHFTLKLTR